VWVLISRVPSSKEKHKLQTRGRKKNHIKTFTTEKRKCENDTEQNLVTALRRAKRRVLVLAPLKHYLLQAAESFLRS
jgi:deoxycytidine triphosphate deaminase